MRRAHWLVAAAYATHAIAWFLPVVKDGVTVPHGVPGWEAFRVAFNAVWPIDHGGFDTWYDATICTISAVATILFIFGSPWVVWRGSAALRRLGGWIAVLAFVDNLWWFVMWSPRSDLRIGYYLWCFSFFLLAFGLFGLAGRGESRMARSTTA